MMNRSTRTLGLVFACCTCAASAETLNIGGVTRTFTAQFADARPAPLVIVLHGNTQTGADMATRTSWPAVAKRERFSIVLPDGLNRAWADLRSDSKRAGRTPPKGTDDVAFIVALIEKFVRDGGRPETNLRHRPVQWRRDDHDDGLRARRSVRGRRQRHHQPDRRIGRCVSSVAPGPDADDERHRRSAYSI
jgi:hypothetical protein